MTKIILPNSIESIGQSAFSGCSSLSHISLPKGLKSIKGWAFDGCTSLTEITLSNSMSGISRHVFSGCSSLIKITLPSSIAIMREGVFEGCKKLQRLIILAFTPPILDDNTFTDFNTNTCQLIVPKESLQAYRSAKGWRFFSNITTGIRQVKENTLSSKQMYNLQGVPLNTKPAHGVYIIGGKKMWAK